MKREKAEALAEWVAETFNAKDVVVWDSSDIGSEWCIDFTTWKSEEADGRLIAVHMWADGPAVTATGDHDYEFRTVLPCGAVKWSDVDLYAKLEAAIRRCEEE